MALLRYLQETLRRAHQQLEYAAAGWRVQVLQKQLLQGDQTQRTHCQTSSL